jgi:hypothetical protein
MANESRKKQEPTALKKLNVTDLKAKKRVNMRRRLTWVVLLSSAITLTALFNASPAWATPANGFTSTPLAQGQFDLFNVFNRFVLPD